MVFANMSGAHIEDSDTRSLMVQGANLSPSQSSTEDKAGFKQDEVAAGFTWGV